MAEETPQIGSMVALWPGIAAAALCGALLLNSGAAAAAGVAGLLMVPLGLASLGGAFLRERENRDWILPATTIVISSPILAAFGALLKANTHHKALAGVTFALIAIGVILGSLAIGARIRQIFSGRAVAIGATALAAVVIFALLWRGGATHLLDILMAIIAVILGISLPIRPSKKWGTVATIVVVAGLIAGIFLGRNPTLAERIRSHSLLVSGLL